MLVVAELNSPILPRLSMVARFLVARNVMFSGKQTTVRKMADQLKNCINQRAHGFYSNRIHTAGSVWITDTITIVMIHYNTSPLKCTVKTGFFLTSGYLFRASDNSNFFRFPLNVWVIGSQLCLISAFINRNQDVWPTSVPYHWIFVILSSGWFLASMSSCHQNKISNSNTLLVSRSNWASFRILWRAHWQFQIISRTSLNTMVRNGCFSSHMAH